MIPQTPHITHLTTDHKYYNPQTKRLYVKQVKQQLHCVVLTLLLQMKTNVCLFFVGWGWFGDTTNKLKHTFKYNVLHK